MDMEMGDYPTLLKGRSSAFIAVLHFTVTVGSSTMRITHILKGVSGMSNLVHCSFCFPESLWIEAKYMAAQLFKITEILTYFHEVLLIHIQQGSHYFEIRGRSDFSFRCWQKRSERQQGEVVRVQGEVKIFLQLYHFLHSQGIIVAFVCYNVLAMH